MAPIHNGMHPGITSHSTPDGVGSWGGAPETFGTQPPTTWGGPSSTTSKGSGSSSPRLPPLEPRRASAAEIASAQAHLVLLKRKMPSRRRTPRESSSGGGPRDRSVGPTLTREASVPRVRPSGRGHSMPPRQEALRHGSNDHGFAPPQDDPEDQGYQRPPKQRPLVQNSPRERDRQMEQPFERDFRMEREEPVRRSGHARREDPVRRSNDTRGANHGGASNAYPSAASASHRGQAPEQVAHTTGAGAYPGAQGGASAPTGGGYEGGALPAGINANQLQEQGAYDQGEQVLVQCEDCGRSFNQKALKIHQKSCKKVFMQKRKKFDSAANRLGEFENADELIHNAKKIEKEVEKKVSNQEKPDNGKRPKDNEEKGKSVPAWKKKSLEFRAAMLAAKAAAGDEDAQRKATTLQQELNEVKKDEAETDPDKIKCPHCGRTFNKSAGERHINICVKMFGGKPGGGRLQKGGGIQAASNKKKEARDDQAVPPPDSFFRSAPSAPPSAPQMGDIRAAAARRTTSSEASRRSLTREQRPTSRQQLPPRR